MGLRNYLIKRCERKELEQVPPPDGGWGWFVCVAAFFIQFIVLGTMNNFGILYVYLFDDFGRRAFLTSLIGSINYGMMFLNGPIAAALAAKYGCRKITMLGSFTISLGFVSSSYAQHIVTLYFTYGVMVGFGASLCYFSALVAVGQYFYRKLSLANGIISSGSGIGSLVMGPVMNDLLKHLGWRHTLRICAATSSLVLICAILYRPINSRVVQDRTDADKEQQKAKFIDFSIFKNKAYIFWCTSLAIFILGYFVPFVHLVKYAQNNGVSADDSSFLIGIMSLASTFGRLLFGPMSDHPRVNRLFLYQFSILFMGVSNTLLPLMKTYATIVCYCLVWGTFEGCYVALCAVLTTDIVGRNKLSSGVGVLFGIKSIPLMGGPALAGIIYDVSNSYDVAFFVAGAVCTLCCLIMFLIPLYLPEVEEEVVDCVKADKVENEPEVNAHTNYGMLGNGISDDSAYDSQSSIVLHTRPESSELSKSQAPTTTQAMSSEFGSTVSIPIIPNPGAYETLQQIPLTTTKVDLDRENHDKNANSLNNVLEEHTVQNTNMPTTLNDNHTTEESCQNCTENSNENDYSISLIPGKETTI